MKNNNESLSETQRLTKKIRTSNQGTKVVDRENNDMVNHDNTIKDLTTYNSSVVQFPKEVSSLHAHSSTPHSSSSKKTTTPNNSHLPTEDNGDYTTMDRNITSQLNDNQDDASNTHQDPPLPFPNHNHNLQGNGQVGRLVLPGAVSYSFRNGRREHRRPPLQWLPGGIMRKQQLTDVGPQPSTVYEVSDAFRSSSYRNRSSDDFSISERDAAEDPNNDSDDDNTEEQQQGRTQVLGDPYLISATLVEDDDTRQRAPPIPITPMVDDTHLLPLVDARTLPETSHTSGLHSREDNSPPQNPEQLPESKLFSSIKGKCLYLSAGVILVVVLVVVLVAALGGGGSAGETEMAMDDTGLRVVPTATPSVLPSLSPSTSVVPSLVPSNAPSTKPSNSQAPSWTPSISTQPSASPTRVVSATELMLRTNFPKVFETEDKQSLSDPDESAYWMRALRFVEETSTELEDWRIAQRYALASIFYATNGVETPYVVEFFGNETGVSMLEWDVGWADQANTPDECRWDGVICTDLVNFFVGDEPGPVVGITLPMEYRATGTVPIEIMILRETLQSLDIKDNLVWNSGWENL